MMTLLGHFTGLSFFGATRLNLSTFIAPYPAFLFKILFLSVLFIHETKPCPLTERQAIDTARGDVFAYLL